MSTNGQTVLISGATGFIAAHVLREFLEAGYNVVGSVRSQASAEKVKKSHAKYADKISFAIVPDISVPGAFDEAVKGVDGVIHLASPFVMDVQDNEKDLLQPAVQGTRGILQSIAKNNPKVKRVVFTSSIASNLDMDKGRWPGHVYSEADWNPISYESAKTADGPSAYCASKTFAEKAAFDFVDKEKPNFSVSAILPSMVYGPAEQAIDDLSKLNTSAADIYRLMDGSSKQIPDNFEAFWSWVDVRDVAAAHRLAYEKPEAANQRYLVTPGLYSYQQIADILRQNPAIRDRVPEGHPGSALPETYRVDGSKAQKELGLVYTPLQKSIADMGEQFLSIEKAIGKA